MVSTAKRFAAGEVHFSYMVQPTEACAWWAKVRGAHPAILALATEWGQLADKVWNEYGQHGRARPVEDYRRVVAEAMGEPRAAEPPPSGLTDQQPLATGSPVSDRTRLVSASPTQRPETGADTASRGKCRVVITVPIKSYDIWTKS
jgi:hypothetical protein